MDSQGEQKDDGAAPSSFTCRLDHVRTVTDVLTCLCVNLKKDHPCHIRATPEGLTFVVTGKGKSTQASADLKADLFEEFICEDDVELTLNLTLLLDCLQLFGSSDSTTATMTYSSEDAIFCLSLTDSGVMTTCEVTTQYQEDFAGIENDLFAAFRMSADEIAALVTSDSLKEAVTELAEVPGATAVCFEVTATGMKLSTRGSGDNVCEIEFPKDTKVFILFRCDEPRVWTFSLASLQLGMKALGVAKETYMRINAEGIMSIQHQIESNKHETFLNFIMVANETLEGDGAADDE